VVHVITGLKLGGAEGVLVRLVTQTGAEFEHVVISLRDQGHYGRVLSDAGIHVYEAGIGVSRGFSGGLVHLVRLIRRERPAIVQTWLYHADVLGGIAARLAGVPVIWNIRNTGLDPTAVSRSARLAAWLSARISRLVPEAIVCNSVTSREEHIRRGYRRDSWCMIPNGCDTREYCPDARLRELMRSKLAVDDSHVVIGCVARWDPQKDHLTLLKAVRIAGEHWPQLRLVLAGPDMDTSNEVLLEHIRAADLGNRTVLLGVCNDVPALMNALDVHVLSSLGEAFPNVVVEAMACGVPCVVTDVGDAAHIVGDSGWIVPSRNPSALADAIGEALHACRAEAVSARKERCRARVMQNFGFQRMLEAYMEVWRKTGRDTG
jgi:glycosyltransferase involved in cell wall biosynthesis